MLLIGHSDFPVDSEERVEARQPNKKNYFGVQERDDICLGYGDSGDSLITLIMEGVPGLQMKVT